MQDRRKEVALLAEGVDRNQFDRFYNLCKQVALLAEGVDRNIQRNSSKAVRVKSPSSRRAWIEIAAHWHPQGEHHVALLAEGVDRNK